MRTFVLALVALAALTMETPAPAAPAFQMDGSLPMYPHAKLDPKETGMPANAIAQGVPLVLETTDSVHTVDVWYTANAPKSCTRNAQSAGVQYKCPGGSIQIYNHEGTQIALIPAFAH
jgi:hypothetical protein